MCRPTASRLLPTAVLLSPRTFRAGVLALLVAGCGSASAPQQEPDALGQDTSSDAGRDAESVPYDGSASGGDGSTAPSDAEAGTLTIRAMTFNTGTGTRPPPALEAAYGWTEAEAALGDAWYGNGLAWTALVDAVGPWLREQAPDLVAFQEVFWTGECDAIPSDAHSGFVCDGAREPTVAARLAGAGYTVVCHPGKPDKCVAVRDTFARVDGCDDGLCIEGMGGRAVDGCGSGSRVARVSLTTPAGVRLDVVHVHGTSGLEPDDVACRTAWIEQAFEGLDPTRPTLMLGDFNTDPARLAASDESARRLAELAADEGFTFATALGVDARPTYAGFLNIDHVLVRGGQGSCLAAGLDAELPGPLALEAFDHRPILCGVEAR